METETLTTLDPWLRQFPPEAQPLIIAWFHYAAGQSPTTPDALLQIVQRLAHGKLDWSTTPQTREVCNRVLLALSYQRAAARHYAKTCLVQKERV